MDAWMGWMLWFLATWLLGTLTGLLLPRPKVPLVDVTSSWKGAILGVHSLLIVRELWHKVTEPGTLRALVKAVALWLCGKGWQFDFPSAGAQPSSSTDAAPAPADAGNNEKWYVTSDDLQFFIEHAENGGSLPGSSAWEVMMDKDVQEYVKYTAWRRTLPCGKTEYKSVTICPDATAEEYIDLYYDDDFRPTWDGMVIGHEVVEHGDFSQRQQVVRWTRRFPFGFISDRQYTIARRLFRQGDCLYAITKGVRHPVSGDPGVVSVDVFYSMWRSRTVECPWGTGKPAVETLLLHHEQLKVPENLARFAVRHGMWGFVKGVADNTRTFVQARRARGVLPHAPDPRAFGSGFAPNPPAVRLLSSSGRMGRGGRCGASTGSLGLVCEGAEAQEGVEGVGSVEEEGGSDGGTGSAAGSAGGYEAPARSSSNAARRLRGLAAFAIAGSLALLMGGPSGGGSGMPRSVRGSRTNLASAAGGSGDGVGGGVSSGESPEPRVSYPGKGVRQLSRRMGSGGGGGGGSGGPMRRSISVASALDQRRRRQQQYRFMQDPIAHWEDQLTE